ncbi:hypothetical protein FHX44_114012 [Pseudonocardia hierapolitana]|uniref:DUF4236 domain-containing protein n=2 Tax=Pseudonocardia hierapolitana TaxID=1128676 RepID=A0A561ST96_9PSEU|nr:hypothetical protein FHX44_114012 [Pseudonocardia hierapolitana]
MDGEGEIERAVREQSVEHAEPRRLSLRLDDDVEEIRVGAASRRVPRLSVGAFRTNRGHPGSMRFHLRKTLRVGPVRIHLTERGVKSWGLRLGRWSWSARTRRHTLDTPGPGYLRSRGRHH